MSISPQSSSGARSPGERALANSLSLVVLTALSLVTFGYQNALLPLYGSAPTRYHLNKVVWLACILGSFAPTLPTLPAILASGILMSAMPYTSYWTAVYTGRMGDVIWGPIATHAIVLAPILYLGTAIVKSLQESHKDRVNGGIAAASYQTITVPVCRMAIVSLQELWVVIPLLVHSDGTQIFHIVGGAAITFWALWPLTKSLNVVTASKSAISIPKKGRSKYTRDVSSTPGTRPITSTARTGSFWRVLTLVALPVMATFLRPPTLAKPLLDPYTHPTAPLRVLSSVHSEYSGIVLVGEVLPPSAEAVRAGGVWIGDRVYRRGGEGPLNADLSGSPLGDSVYGTFIMQEAARLVESHGSIPRKEALVIGLGAGIASTAFAQHNLSTTVVEIDPVVYEAARRYFGLVVPESGHLFLEDARQWVHERRVQTERHGGGDSMTSEPPPLFDIVIHDCFSGGGVPSHIFTVNFWQDLRGTMKSDGVVAVNFAGKLGSQSSRAIVITLAEVFPQCRAFHDSMEALTEEKLRTEFINWVFFCTPSTEPLVFRGAVEADFLGSYLRERVLSTLQDREVPIQAIIGLDMPTEEKTKYILTDQHNPLAQWQETDALHHWGLMRKVLPDIFWEVY